MGLMEKRENKRQVTLEWKDLYANARVADQLIKLPILDISIGGMGVLLTEGFSILQEGTPIIIENLEKQGEVINTAINGRVAHLGPGVPSRVGIEFSPAETPIEAYTELHKESQGGKLITSRDEIFRTFEMVKESSRGYGDMLMLDKQKAIPAEFFYLRPNEDNMVLRVVRMSEFRLPFKPEIGRSYPFYLFKGINVMFFNAKVVDVVKNIIETTWPKKLKNLSRRSVLRYLVTGQEPIVAHVAHPLNGKDIPLFIWDISIEGMGAEMLVDDMPLLEGMQLSGIKVELPNGVIEASGTVRSIRTDEVLQKTQVGIEFGEGNYRDQLLEYILSMDLPSEGLLEEFREAF